LREAASPRVLQSLPHAGLQRCLIVEPTSALRCAAAEATLQKEAGCSRDAPPRRTPPTPHAAAARRRRTNGRDGPANAAPPGPLYKGLGRAPHGRDHGPHEPDAALIAASLRRLHAIDARRLQE